MSGIFGNSAENEGSEEEMDDYEREEWAREMEADRKLDEDRDLELKKT